jgi:hypothetical protein
MDRKWATIFLFYIAPAGSLTQDLLALIPCRTACSSQCDQKTDLMEETRQYIYTSTTINQWLIVDLIAGKRCRDCQLYSLIAVFVVLFHTSKVSTYLLNHFPNLP